MDASSGKLDRDRMLLQAFLRGDAEACRRVERWAWEIVYFKPYGIPRDERDDLVQQALAGTWQAASRPGFVLRQGLRPFVRTVAMARCIDWLRRLRDQVELDPALPDPGRDPSEIAARHERAAMVDSVLQRIDASCRELIHEHIYLDRSYGEIARRLDRPEATLRVRMFNCLKAVRRLLTTAGVGA